MDGRIIVVGVWDWSEHPDEDQSNMTIWPNGLQTQADCRPAVRRYVEVVTRRSTETLKVVPGKREKHFYPANAPAT